MSVRAEARPLIRLQPLPCPFTACVRLLSVFMPILASVTPRCEVDTPWFCGPNEHFVQSSNTATPQSVRPAVCKYFSPDRSALTEECMWCFEFQRQNLQQPTHTVTASPPSSEPVILLLPHSAYVDSGPLTAHAIESTFQHEDWPTTFLLIQVGTYT